MQLPYGEGYNSWSKKQGDVIYIDPVNGEEIDININPDRWKELDNNIKNIINKKLLNECLDIYNYCSEKSINKN